MYSLQFQLFEDKMFLLSVICLIGTALAAPVIPDAPIIPAESHILMSPYITYPEPTLFLRTLDMKIEPEPKEEDTEWREPMEELEEPKEELYEKEEELELKEEIPELKEELKEPKEVLPELPIAPELPKLEIKPEPVVIKLDIPKPPTFISNWINSFPNFSLPPFITNWFGSNTNPPKLLYPAYYPGYPGAVIVESPKL